MLESVITDSGFTLTLRWILASIFLAALVHKLKDSTEFRATLENYELLPKSLLAPSYYLLVIFELVSVIALVGNFWFGGLCAAGLLSMYTLAISINIARGRMDIDCGCSGPAVKQTLSVWLVARNLALIGLALLTLLDTTYRELVLLDGFTSLAAVIAFTLIYSTAAQLSRPEQLSRPD